MSDAGADRSRSSGRLTDGGGFFLAVIRGRPVVRRVASGLSLLFGVLGLGMLAYPFATNLFQGRLQQRLEVQLASPEIKQAYAAGKVDEGDSLTRLRIPTVGVDVVVVEGTTTSALRAGAGHYPNTPLPGDEGNVAIAGHRTTYGRPFANLDRVHPGDEIALDTPLGTHVYRVSREPYVVANNDWQPIAQRPGKTLTLTTCHPKGSARQRLVVKAELIEGA